MSATQNNTTEREMNIDEAKIILDTNLSLGSYWREFIDPSCTTEMHHDPMILAEEAMDSFAADWEDLADAGGHSMDRIFSALEIAAREAIEDIRLGV
jgi:hypothetical protein